MPFLIEIMFILKAIRSHFNRLYDKQNLRPDFTPNLVHVHGLAFGTSKFYIAFQGKINHRTVNLNSICDMKSGLAHVVISDEIYETH